MLYWKQPSGKMPNLPDGCLGSPCFTVSYDSMSYHDFSCSARSVSGSVTILKQEDMKLEVAGRGPLRTHPSYCTPASSVFVLTKYFCIAKIFYGFR